MRICTQRCEYITGEFKWEMVNEVCLIILPTRFEMDMIYHFTHL